MKCTWKSLVVVGMMAIQSLALQAQETFKIKFSETVFFDQNINIPPQMRAEMPKSREIKKILFANDSSSIYVTNKEDITEAAPEEAGRRFQRRRNVEGVVYNNINLGSKTTFTDMFGKEFLIEESYDPKWKLHSGEQRDILGHTCIKASMLKDTTTISAWFAADLPYSIGPDGYAGLPGIILALSEGESKVILATSIEENPELKIPIEAPAKGEKVTREEYEKIRKQKMEEMKQMWGGQGQGQRFFRGN